MLAWLNTSFIKFHSELHSIILRCVVVFTLSEEKQRFKENMYSKIC